MNIISYFEAVPVQRRLMSFWKTNLLPSHWFLADCLNGSPPGFFCVLLIHFTLHPPQCDAANTVLHGYMTFSQMTFENARF